jgi:hypothetical protein
VTSTLPGGTISKEKGVDINFESCIKSIVDEAVAPLKKEVGSLKNRVETLEGDNKKLKELVGIQIQSRLAQMKQLLHSKDAKDLDDRADVSRLKVGISKAENGIFFCRLSADK